MTEDTKVTSIRIAHAIPGRIRLRIPALKGNSILGREVAEHIWTLAGVRWVETNASTGSLVVEYDPENPAWRDQPDEMVGSLVPLLPELDVRTMADAFTTAPGSTSLTASLRGERVHAFVRNVNERVSSATGGADLALLVPATLVVLGLQGLFFAEKLRFPQWFDLLWFGLGTFMMFNVAAAARAPAAADRDGGSSVP